MRMRWSSCCCPTSLGLTNVVDSAVQLNLDPTDPLFGFPVFPSQVAADVDSYLFFDGIHPTARGHQLIGNAAYQATVPEPASVLVWSSGLLAFVVFASRRKSRSFRPAQ